MTYVIPAGWIEPLPSPDKDGQIKYGRFHTRSDCPRINDRDKLTKVDRPYSAKRCTLCAKE